MVKDARLLRELIAIEAALATRTPPDGAFALSRDPFAFDLKWPTPAPSSEVLKKSPSTVDVLSPRDGDEDSRMKSSKKRKNLSAVDVPVKRSSIAVAPTGGILSPRDSSKAKGMKKSGSSAQVDDRKTSSKAEGAPLEIPKLHSSSSGWTTPKVENKERLVERSATAVLGAGRFASAPVTDLV